MVGSWSDLDGIGSGTFNLLASVAGRMASVGPYGKRSGAFAKRIGPYGKRSGAYAKRIGAYAKRIGAYAKRIGPYDNRSGHPFPKKLKMEMLAWSIIFGL